MNLIELLNRLALGGGDWVIYLLLITSVVSVYIIGERYFYYWVISGRATVIQKILSDGLNNGDVAGVREKLRRYNCPEARMLAMGLSAEARGSANVAERMQSQLIKEKAAMDSGLAVLGTVGSNAPFVGLFGTVLGVIKAFHELSLQGNGSGNTVMSGISQALIATAVGILVAIPALVAYNYFKNRQKSAVATLESLMHLALSYLKLSPQNPS